VKAAKLFKRDDDIRKRLGWAGCAFIGPKLPEPRTEAERAVRKLMHEYDPEDNVYMAHIYDVLELMERAYLAGKKNR
jgi:hypothetical protein